MKHRLSKGSFNVRGDVATETGLPLSGRCAYRRSYACGCAQLLWRPVAESAAPAPYTAALSSWKLSPKMSQREDSGDSSLRSSADIIFVMGNRFFCSAFGFELAYAIARNALSEGNIRTRLSPAFVVNPDTVSLPTNTARRANHSLGVSHPRRGSGLRRSGYVQALMRPGGIGEPVVMTDGTVVDPSPFQKRVPSPWAGRGEPMQRRQLFGDDGMEAQRTPLPQTLCRLPRHALTDRRAGTHRRVRTSGGRRHSPEP